MRWNAIVYAGLLALAACAADRPMTVSAAPDTVAPDGVWPDDAMAAYFAAQDAYIDCIFTTALMLEPCGRPADVTAEAAIAACADHSARTEAALREVLPAGDPSDQGRRQLAEVVEALQADLAAAIERLRTSPATTP